MSNETSKHNLSQTSHGKCSKTSQTPKSQKEISTTSCPQVSVQRISSPSERSARNKARVSLPITKTMDSCPLRDYQSQARIITLVTPRGQGKRIHSNPKSPIENSLQNCLSTRPTTQTETAHQDRKSRQSSTSQHMPESKRKARPSSELPQQNPHIHHTRKLHTKDHQL
ncbi:hypothetical protein Dimus_038323 [Dionaea muscipula]